MATRFIVYDVSQIRMEYLLKMDFKYKWNMLNFELWQELTDSVECNKLEAGQNSQAQNSLIPLILKKILMIFFYTLFWSYKMFMISFSRCEELPAQWLKRHHSFIKFHHDYV